MRIREGYRSAGQGVSSYSGRTVPITWVTTRTPSTSRGTRLPAPASVRSTRTTYSASWRARPTAATPGSAAKRAASADLAARALARSVMQPWSPSSRPGDRGPPSARVPLDAEGLQHGGHRVGEGDPAAGAATLGRPGEQQAQRCAVTAAPDHRTAVPAGAERPGQALDLHLVVEGVHAVVVLHPHAVDLDRGDPATGVSGGPADLLHLLVRVHVRGAGDAAPQRTPGVAGRVRLHAGVEDGDGGVHQVAGTGA